MTTLEEKVDRRLMETRPIWESVLEQLKEVNARLDKVEFRIDNLEKESKDFHSWLRKNYFELGKEQVRFDDCLEKLEETILPRQ